MPAWQFPSERNLKLGWHCGTTAGRGCHGVARLGAAAGRETENQHPRCGVGPSLSHGGFQLRGCFAACSPLLGKSLRPGYCRRVLVCNAIRLGRRSRTLA
eukprot:304528-Rhodomonas_salina.2